MKFKLSFYTAIFTATLLSNITYAMLRRYPLTKCAPAAAIPLVAHTTSMPITNQRYCTQSNGKDRIMWRMLNYYFSDDVLEKRQEASLRRQQENLRRQQEEHLKYLIRRANDRDALAEAVTDNDVEKTKFALAAGHDANAAIYYQANAESTDSIYEISYSDALDKKRQGYRCETMLTCAIKNKNYEIIRLLHAHDARLTEESRLKAQEVGLEAFIKEVFS